MIGRVFLPNRFDEFRERSRDPALSMLLLVQGVTVFGLVPGTAIWTAIPQGIVAVLPLTFLSIFIATSHGKWGFGSGAAALLLSGAVAILQFWPDNTFVLAGGDLAAIVTLSLLSIVVFKAV